MTKNTGKSHFERFLAAIAGGEDQRAEQLVHLLDETDEPALLRLAESTDPEQRWWALRALAQVGSQAAASVLSEALHDPDPAVRSVAVMALGTLFARGANSKGPILPRMAALLADDEGLVRQVAAEGLARCGDDAVPVLAEALDSPHDGVRVRAAFALHRIGTMATALPLYHHLNDPSPLVRHYAYETLDRLGLLTNVLLSP
jgi:HEAT repeat protein